MDCALLLTQSILHYRARWRDLPARYGNWNSIYHKFRRWCSHGLFERLLQLINTEVREAIVLEMDSTFCKVHQSACSALKDQAIGSSRGGKNTKIHVLINERMQLLNVVLTGGQIHDSESAFELFSGIEIGGKTILADKSYSSENIRVFLLSMVPLLVSPIKPITGLSMTLILNCTNNATLLSGFFSASRITATLPLDTINWLFALRISFYSLLVLFTFNLPTTPNLLSTLSRFLGSLKSKLTLSFGLILPIAHLDKWDSNLCLSMEEFSACVSKFSVCMAELGFNIPDLYPFHPTPKNTFCAAVRQNSFVLRPDGSIGKCFDCEQSVGDVFRGIAHDSTTKSNLSQWLDFSPFDDPECKNCPVLPICLGGCSFFRIFRRKKLCLKWKFDLASSLRQIFYRKGGDSS